MSFDEYSNQMISLLGPEKERFCDAIGTVTNLRRMVTWILLGLVNIVFFAILIAVACASESGSRFVIAGGGIIGLLIVDAFIIIGTTSGRDRAMIGIHERGIVVGCESDCQRFLVSELLQCREMDRTEVQQFEAMYSPSNESMVVLNTEQYFLGFSFKRNGMENCYIQIFNNRNIFNAALNACCQLVESNRSSTPEYRTWTSKSGKTIVAAFRKEQNGMILLACPDGSFIKVAADDLIEQDQLYVFS